MNNQYNNIYNTINKGFNMKWIKYCCLILFNNYIGNKQDGNHPTIPSSLTQL